LFLLGTFKKLTWTHWWYC